MALQAEQPATGLVPPNPALFLKPEPQRSNHPTERVPSATKSVAQTEKKHRFHWATKGAGKHRSGRIWGEKLKTIKNREATTEQPAKPFPIASVPAAARLGRIERC